MYRKISQVIEQSLKSNEPKMLILDGARQIGKSYIIREVGRRLFTNYVEINMEEYKFGARLFAGVKTINDFYLALSTFGGNRLKKRENTLVLIDDMEHLSNIPIEIKSGKDYKTHSALDKFCTNAEYNIQRAVVLSNEQRVFTERGITYMPIYYIMFFARQKDEEVVL